MPKAKKPDSFLYPVLFMTGLALTLTLILASLNFVTAGTIERQAQTQIRKNVLYALGIPFVDKTPEQIDELFAKSIEHRPYKEPGMDLYIQKEGGNPVAYAFPLSGKGLWGTIHSYLAVNAEATSIIGFDVVKHEETPGLGGRIEEPWFKEQLRGLDISKEQATYINYKPAPNGLDAITGATLTSTSVRDILNQGIKDVKTQIQEGVK